MTKLSVSLPTVIPVPDINETEAERYGEVVCDFLAFAPGRKKAKYEFLGYIKRYAQIIFYTEKSSKGFKKLYRDTNKEIEEWYALQEEEEQVCPTCGHVD